MEEFLQTISKKYNISINDLRSDLRACAKKSGAPGRCTAFIARRCKNPVSTRAGDEQLCRCHMVLVLPQLEPPREEKVNTQDEIKSSNDPVTKEEPTFYELLKRQKKVSFEPYEEEEYE